jgi:hypothetical protein
LCASVPQILDNIAEDQVSPSGGFGPVADDGYGVSYMIASDDQVGCHATTEGMCWRGVRVVVLAL